jgi:SAM-dependent methyltransferase
MPHATWAQLYDEAYRVAFGDSYDALTAATVDYVAELQPLVTRILDVGAGTGRLALPLSTLGYTVVATDPCAEMLAVLRNKAEQKGLKIETVCCRMQDELKSPPFDLVLCVFTVLLYLLDESALNASFEGAAAALRPGGRLLFDIPSRQVFNSYRRASPEFERDVRVIPETEVVYRYEEHIRVRQGNDWVNYHDSFKIRHWEQSQVVNALNHAGFSVERDLGARFAGTGSHYYLARRLPLRTADARA